MLKQVQTDTKQSATEDSAAIEIKNVTKTFEQWQRGSKFKDIISNMVKPQKKTITALNDISLTINHGEFAAYAGANGAGKSTTMKLLSGMLVPKSGDISVLGLSPQKDRIAIMRRIGVLFGNRTELWWDHPIAQSFEWKRVVWDIPKTQFEKTRDNGSGFTKYWRHSKHFRTRAVTGATHACGLGTHAFAQSGTYTAG